MTKDALRFGEYVLEPAPIRLCRRGEAVALPIKPLQLLALLAERPGELVTHDEIRQALWPDRVIDYSQSVHVYIRQLRKALADDAEAPVYITTEPRQGYRFLAPVERVAVEPPGLASRLPRHRLSLAVGIVAGLLVLAIGWTWLSQENEPLPPTRFAGWDSYERGLYLLNAGRPSAALSLLAEAQVQSPDEAAVLAALSRAHIALGRIGAAREQAQAALGADPLSADAHEAMAHVLALADWNWRDARQHLDTALDLDPQHVPAMAGRAALNAMSGDLDAARDQMAQARQAAPSVAILATDLALFTFYAGQYRDAIEISRDATELGAPRDLPDRIIIRSLFALGAIRDARPLLLDELRRHDVAEADLQRLRDLSDDALMTEVYAIWLRRLGGEDGGYAIQAVYFALLDQPDEAARTFASAVTAREPMAALISLDPAFDTLRGHAVFREAVMSMGLPDPLTR
jgi:DNA-binding winged helix-turn-helix (wHTH) protein/Tfp pilus assembly protein PilF